MNTLLHTFDYELFFGNSSGTAENCLLRPMEHILETFRLGKRGGLIFVDCLYLARLQEVASGSAQSDLKAIRSQLAESILRGFHLGVHLHPHWLDATYDGQLNQWHFPTYERYTLHRVHEKQRVELFLSAIGILKEIYSQAERPAPKRFANRAGGWCIEPFEALLDGFLAANIEVDSSVVPGLAFPDSTQPFNFRSIPSGAPPWSFSQSSMKSEKTGRFLELPITTFRPTLGEVIKRRWDRRPVQYYGDGRSILLSQVSTISRWTRRLTRRPISVLSLETLRTVCEGQRHVLAQISASEKSTFVSVTHPKGLQKFPEMSDALLQSWAFDSRIAELRFSGEGQELRKLGLWEVK